MLNRLRDADRLLAARQRQIELAQLGQAPHHPRARQHGGHPHQAESPRERYLVRVRVGLGSGTFLWFIPYQRDSSWADSNKVRFAPPEP